MVAIVLIISTTNFFASLASYVTQPFFKEGESLTTSFSFLGLLFGNRAQLAQEVQNLQTQITELKALQSDLSAVNFENERLRAELKMKPKAAMLHGSIIARSPQIPLDALMINIGSLDGVKQNDLVFASDRSVVGKISKVTRETSTVLLNSSPLTKTQAFVGRTGDLIEIEGSGGNSILANVPLDFDINVGDSVLTSYTSDNVIAVVGAIEEDKVVGQKRVLMSLPVSVSQLKSVFVLPSPSE